MKVILRCLAAAAGLATASANVGEAAISGEKTISKVVKLLEGMLDKSKEDGEAERVIFAKFRCYCDKEKEEKEGVVEEMTTMIGVLGSKIEDLQGSSGQLSQECAQLQADITANEQGRSEAESVRKKANEAFVKEEQDLTAALASLGQAVDVLSEIGAGSSLLASAEHVKFMANYESKQGQAALVKLSATVKQALLAANTFLKPAEKKKLESFLQAPLAKNFKSQSDDIIGILKQMKETFASNVESAKAAEKASVEAHTKFMETMTEEHTALKESYDKKQEVLSGNDGELAGKREQLSDSETAKADAEAFLEELQDQCTTKSEEYDKRVMMRQNEEAAIAKAIAILNSDQAFSTFGRVAATSSGATGFLQLQSIQRHNAALMSDAPVRESVERLLAKHSTRRLRRVAVLLQAGNPFETIFTEIDKMKALIQEEAKVDKQQLDWCTKETEQNEATLSDKKTLIETLNGEITDLENSINDPETGLKKQIADTEEQLETNAQNQATETQNRKEANAVYEKSVADAVEAAALLQRAVKVLKKYYAAMEEKAAEGGSSLMQKAKQPEEVAPPESWETGSYKGQSEQGNSAITMIEFILEETKKEEQGLHDTEDEQVKAYDEMMTTLKEEAVSLGKTLVDTKQTLAETELELEGKRADLKVTTKEKEAVENYLAKIKPGCDFITTNYDSREASRSEESAALDKAVELLKATPAYKNAEAK
eukprot:TRINITY_DN111232_c0_g1_i1.p1 TRINITY_DN111232_c0_g1~~TRINITY_DN111232_c0_g1_i1.p1  ORF type:complete len:714 (+),score=290.58 TRINITY_DN111232_c0_g1_i1:82-2223(+)